jgi:hypothetical protein
MLLILLPYLRSTYRRHTPRMRGIQYAAAFRLNHWRLWNTGSSACADDDGDGLEPSLRAKRSNPSLVLDPAARSARVMLQSFAPKEIRGRRECRVRAAPAVSCAKVHKENAHEPTGSAEALRHSPRAPRRRIRLVTVDSELMAFPNPVRSACLRQLDTSNGCQDHTASPYAATSFVCAPRSLTSQSSPCNHVHAPDAAASTASHPNVRDDRDTPLLRDETAGFLDLICVGRREEYSQRGLGRK